MRMTTTANFHEHMTQDKQQENATACSQDAFWDYIDAVVVINLDFRQDRWAHFLRDVSAFLPEQKLHRLSAVEGRKISGYGQQPWFTERTGERAAVWGGVAGCALSHRNAIALAKEKGWRNVLILEDDVEMLPFTPASSSLLCRAMELISGRPAMFYLGFNKPVPYGLPILSEGAERTVWKVDGVLAAHSYLVTSELYDTMLELLPQKDSDIWLWLSRYRAIDTFYRDFVPVLPGVGVYAVVPDLFRQAGGKSNIQQGYDNAKSFICSTPPHSYRSLNGLLYLLLTPFRRLKVHLNAYRTYRRASRGGLPGLRRRRR